MKKEELEFKTEYNGLKGLKVVLCIGIVMTHIMVNTQYQIDGYVYNNIIPVFMHFVLLFMMISAFGMCCGYYQKIKNNEISPKEFYSKRVKRILPFFAIVTIIEVIFNRDLKTLLDSSFNFTLTRGLVPNYENNVIGVGWFIGIVFLFYIAFPYFVYLIDNKKKAWLTFIVSIGLNLILTYSMKEIGQLYLLYSFPYFVLGGIIYLYKDSITKFLESKTWLRILMIIGTTALFLVIPSMQYTNIFKYLVLFGVYLICAMSNNTKISNNKVINHIGKYTMQIYLCHMLAFRLLEKTHLINITHNDILDYILVCIATLVGAYLFSFVVEKIIEIIQGKITNKKAKVN